MDVYCLPVVAEVQNALKVETLKHTESNQLLFKMKMLHISVPF